MTFDDADAIEKSGCTRVDRVLAAVAAGVSHVRQIRIRDRVAACVRRAVVRAVLRAEARRVVAVRRRDDVRCVLEEADVRFKSGCLGTDLRVSRAGRNRVRRVDPRAVELRGFVRDVLRQTVDDLIVLMVCLAL